MVSRDTRQTRSLNAELKIREVASNNDEMCIEGYFIVFGQQTELWAGAYEEIAPNALDKTLNNDIRALINHDTRLVLGRNKSGTLELRVDGRGLFGKIKVNSNDTEAVNLYERVKRGDVSQCSFGFNIISEETEWRDDGTVKWTITEVDLHEVSVVTFPAYEETGVQARQASVEAYREKQILQKKNKLKVRLKNYGIETTITK